MAICIYTYIYVTSSRLIGWKFCCNSTFLFPHMDTHFIHFFALDENIPYNRRSFSRYYSCMAPYAPSTYSTCLISLARVISILLKKKKSLPFWRKLIALLFFYHALLTYVFVSLYVSFHFFFFYTNIACIEEFYKTLLYIYNLWSIAIRSNILDNRSVD